MKRILLLLVAFFLLHLFSFAGRPQTRLSVTVLANYPVRILVNGVNYNLDNRMETDLFIQHLRPGYHQIQVFRKGRSAFNHPSSGGSVLYRGTVFLRSGFHTDMIINRFGNVFQDEIRIDRYSDPYYGNGGYGMGNSMCMDKVRFDEMKNTLRSIAFEDTRLQTSKQMISTNTLGSAQVKELMQLFSFESNKVELAKYAYDHTADPENYFNIYDAFAFNSSRDEMNRFIQNER